MTEPDSDLAAADAFERLQNAATPGPWASRRWMANPHPTEHEGWNVSTEDGRWLITYNKNGASGENNAAFIAASRTTDLPARIRRLVAENAELERELSHECPKCHTAILAVGSQDGCVGCENVRLRAALEELRQITKKPDDCDGDREESAFRSGIRHAISYIKTALETTHDHA